MARNGPLTRAEREILTQVAQGHTRQQIAHSRGRPIKSVGEHLRNARRKLDAKDDAVAAARASAEGWLDELTPAQSEYLDRFDRWLRAPHTDRHDRRDELTDQLHVMLDEAGVDRAAVPRYEDAP